MARAHQVGQSVEWKFLMDRKLQEVDRSVWRGHIVVVNCMPMSCIRRGEWARFRRPGAVAISVPSRGVRARQGNGSCGRRPLVCFRFRPLTKAAFDGPETKNSRLLSQPAAVPLSCGESEIRTRDTLLGYTRFPGVPLQPLEHLSNTYPGPFGQNRTAKVIIFSGSASTGGSIFPRGAIKSGCGRCNRGILRGNG